MNTKALTAIALLILLALGYNMASDAAKVSVDKVNAHQELLKGL